MPYRALFCSNSAHIGAAIAERRHPRSSVRCRIIPDVRHLKIEDGPGKLLGRSFRVKLWPTLVFLRDGAVVEIVARPEGEDIQRGFEALTGNVSGATESP